MITDYDVKRVESAVKPLYGELKDWVHAWPHIERVALNSRKLAEIVGADQKLCVVAAYCHDLGRIKEEKNQQDSTRDHHIDSVEATFDILSSLGITGSNMLTILEAVGVHSDKLYDGRNFVARVLRDSDKKDSLGPWGVLRHARYHLKRDFVDQQEIIDNTHNPETIKKLGDRTLRAIKQNSHHTKQYTPILDFVLEWFDNRMLDLPQSYHLLSEDDDYVRRSRRFLEDDT